MLNIRRRFFSVMLFTGASAILSGCGYYPQYVDSSFDLWAPWDDSERGYVVCGNASSVVNRLGIIGWHGNFLEFAAGSGVNDSTLEHLKSLRDSGRIGFSSLNLRDASGCSSQSLCDVSEWPGLKSVRLVDARFDAEASPRFSETLSGYDIEGAVFTSPDFWAGVGASNLECLHFSVSAEMLNDRSLLRLRSQKGDVVYDLTPTDYAARDKIFEVVAELRKEGETRSYSWVDEYRRSSSL